MICFYIYNTITGEQSAICGYSWPDALRRHPSVGPEWVCECEEYID